MLTKRLPLLAAGGFALIASLGLHPATAQAKGWADTGSDGIITVGDSSPGSPGSSAPATGGNSGKRLECVPSPTLPTGVQHDVHEDLFTCRYVNVDGSGAGPWFLSWSVDSPAIKDPETIAQEIVTSMNLSALPLGMVPEDGPNVFGLVGLPVWFWTPADQWQERSRSKSSGGLNVSVTAKVERVVIRTGDGKNVSCLGPGTPYEDSYGIRRSPDCGHVYEKKSGPGRKYSITATTYFRAVWRTGSGETGTIDIDRSTTRQLAIGEAQALRQ